MAGAHYRAPNMELANNVLEDNPGNTSGLSEALSDVDEYDYEYLSDAGPAHFPIPLWPGRGSTCHRKRPFSTVTEDPLIPDHDLFDSGPVKKAKVIPDDRDLAPFEKLPAETLQNIAAWTECDADLAHLQLVSRKIAFNVTADDSAVWKRRFLAKFDHPIIRSHLEFSVAYKIRQYILNANNFIDFRHGKDQRLELQLAAIKDMILETYHKPKEWLPTLRSSKNLACLSSPKTSPWIITFLSSPFYDYGNGGFGLPNDLFDTLQLTLSHLVLSPKSPTAKVVQASRDHYDITRVYNWNQPFSLLFNRLPERQHESFDEHKEFKSAIFPNLRKPSPKDRGRKTRYKLDTHSLLHIRNFWQRHLIDKETSYITAAGVRENTYASMAKDLAKLNHTPRKWSAPLQDPDGNLQGIFDGNWYGHYSGLQPWPKKKADLKERQTNAEDWDEISPLMLDFASYADNSSSAWPPLFSTIRAFENSSPEPTPSSRRTFYIRGIAPFVDIAAELERKNAEQNSTLTLASTSTLISTTLKTSSSSLSRPEYHPYLSLRLRGIIHPLPNQADIPGWQRIIMVLFRPRPHYLIQVLEHAEEDYGSSFSVNVSTQLQHTTVHAILSGQNHGIDPVEATKHLEAYLRRKLKDGESEGRYSPEVMTRSRIEELETRFSPGEHLGWEDVEYAYAYEGCIVPGGGVMMGRWWRIGEVGLGAGKEVDVQGESVVVQDDVEQEEDCAEAAGVDEGSEGGVEGIPGRGRSRQPTTAKGLERGVFCFWC